MEDLQLFLKRLRRICHRKEIKLKYIAVVETKRMTNPHIHLIVNRMDPEIIAEAWDGVPDGGGNVSFQPMDRRGNPYKLARAPGEKVLVQSKPGQARDHIRNRGGVQLAERAKSPKGRSPV